MSRHARNGRLRIGWRVAVLVSVVLAWASALGVFALYKAQLKAADAATPPPVVAEVVAPPVVHPPHAPPEPVPEPLTVVIPIPVTPPPPKPVANRPFWAKDLPTDFAQGPPEPCQTFGTAVKFTRTATEAMVRAGREEKLLFVLHLAGNLEDDGFT
jgi:hypothetical protein